MSGTRLAAALASLIFSNREVTPHGFLATACTLLSELGWRAEAIERQLAHAVGDLMRCLYKPCQYLSEPIAMMQARADYLDQLQASAAGRHEFRRSRGSGEQYFTARAGHRGMQPVRRLESHRREGAGRHRKM